MSYDQYLGQIDDLLKAQGHMLDAQSRNILQLIWEKWEHDHPVHVKNDPETGSPVLTLIAEEYEKVHGSSYSSSIYKATSKTTAHIYKWDENGSAYLTKGGVIYKNGNPVIDETSLSIAEQENITFGQGIGISTLQSRYGEAKHGRGLAATIGNYLVPLIGRDISDDLEPIVKQKEKARLHPHISAFYDEALEPEIKDIIARTNARNTTTLEWLRAGHDPVKQRNRLQAANAYPVLLSVFDGRYRHDRNFKLIKNDISYDKRDKEADRLNENLEGIRQAIDNGDELTPLLQSHLLPIKVSAATLRSISKIKSVPDNFNFTDFLTCVQYLEEIDPSQHPRSTESLAAFLPCVSRAHSFKDSTARPVIDTLKNIKGQWQEWLDATVSDTEARNIKDWQEQLKKTFATPLLWRQIMQEDAERSNNALKNIFDRVSGAKKQSISKLKNTIDLRADKFIKELLASVPEKDLIALSLKWHEDITDYTIQLDALGIAQFDDLAGWVPLSGAVQAPNGIWLRPLTTKKEIRVEGTAQSHCVGGYYTQCLAGQDHIISLTSDAVGQQRLTTAQLREKRSRSGDVKDLKVFQHKGYKNRDAGTAESAAIQWYVKEILENPDMKPDWPKIDKARENARERKDESGIVGKLGFDPEDRSRCEAAYDLIREYLPRKIGKHGYDKAVTLASKAAPSLNEKFKEPHYGGI